MEDLIPDEDTVIAMTHLGYIKRMDVDNFRSQNRGGKGIKGMQTIEEDYIEDLLMTTNHHYMMFFTNTGRVYRLKAYEIPEAGRTARGTAIINLLQLMPEEKITAIIPMREFNDDKYLFMATKNGMVKKTPMVEYEHVRKNGLQAIVLRDGDELYIPQMQSTVKMSGAVTYPNSVTYTKGMSVMDCLSQAGGYNDIARKYPIVIYMNGKVATTKRTAIFFKRYPKVEPGCEIVVPTKTQRERRSLAEIMSISSSATSMAAMITSIVNMIKN